MVGGVRETILVALWDFWGIWAPHGELGWRRSLDFGYPVWSDYDKTSIAELEKFFEQMDVVFSKYDTPVAVGMCIGLKEAISFLNYYQTL